MARLRLIVAGADPKSALDLAHGFERAGAEPHSARDTTELAARLATPDRGLAVVELGPEAGPAPFGLDSIRMAALRMPVLALGDPARRADALSAGAALFLARPAELGDVVLLGSLLGARGRDLAAAMTGELTEHGGGVPLLRALAASGVTGVLRLVRGARKAEVRLFEGELTSAAVGAQHGLAAVRQLVLWPTGRFELRSEAVVRRQQIPLSAAEVCVDCQQFLRDFAEVAGELTAETICEQDLRRVAEQAGNIPREVSRVLRLFDGMRTLADVTEDSTFGVFDTVRIARRLLELGALMVATSPHPRIEAAVLLAVEDWRLESNPSATALTPALGVRALRERELGGGTAGAASPSTGAAPMRAPTWGGVTMARSVAATTFAPVVPSQVVSGEVLLRRPAPDVHLAVAAVVVADDLASTQSEPPSSPTHGVPRGANPDRGTAPLGRVALRVESVAAVSTPAMGTPAVPLEVAAAPPEVAAAPPEVAAALASLMVADAVVENPDAPSDERHFSDPERDFFDQEHAISNVPSQPVDTFADLMNTRERARIDEPGFWRKLFPGPGQLPTRGPNSKRSGDGS